MKKKTTTTKDKGFIDGLSDKLIKNYKLDGVIVIAAKGNEINVDVGIPGRLAPKFLEALKKTSETIMMSSLEHILGRVLHTDKVIKKSKSKK